jgi:hypothetical protein
MTWHAFFLISVIVGFAFNPLSYLGGILLIAAILRSPHLADQRFAVSRVKANAPAGLWADRNSSRPRE